MIRKDRWLFNTYYIIGDDFNAYDISWDSESDTTDGVCFPLQKSKDLN